VVIPTPGELVVVDRRGQVTPLGAPVRGYQGALRLSPDGRRLAVTIFSPTEVGLWTYDIARGGTPTPVNQDGESEWPLWTPDGQRLVFGWLKNGQHSIAIQPADGTAPPTVLLPGGALPSSFTKDGRRLAGVVQPDNDIVVVNMAGDKPTVESQSRTRETEFWPEFSPDGRWLAYGSDVSGQEEVWVRPYPGPGPAVRVSLDGGRAPAWHPNGRELFFVKRVGSTDKRLMMAVDFTPGSPPRPGRPHILFTFTLGKPFLGGDPLRSYEVAPDGDHFYAVRMSDFSASPPVTHINLIQSWFEELKAKVPTGR
jgi:Tol biopolymer transport system component